MPQENLEIKNPEFVIEGVSLKHSDKDTNSLSLNIQINEVFGNFKINNEYHVEHKQEIENTKGPCPLRGVFGLLQPNRIIYTPFC